MGLIAIRDRVSVPRLVCVKSIIVIVVSEVLTIQRAGDGRVAQLVIGGAGGLDGQLRGPLRGQGGAHALPPVIPGVIVNEHWLLLGAGHVTRVPSAAGHVVMVRAEVLRTDGVTRTGWHLDRGHDGAHVVMMRSKTRGRLRSLAVQLTSCMLHELLREIGPTVKIKRLQTFLRKSHNIVHALI
mgnify:CR=1 FL=1